MLKESERAGLHCSIAVALQTAVLGIMLKPQTVFFFPFIIAENCEELLPLVSILECGEMRKKQFAASILGQTLISGLFPDTAPT